MNRTITMIAAVLLITGLAWMGATRATTEVAPEAGTSEHAVRPVVIEKDGLERKAESLVPANAAPLAPITHKGLDYLANQQLPGGGWGQGGGWRTGGRGRIQPIDQQYQDAADVANTAVATLALIRGGVLRRAAHMVIT